MPRQSTVTIGGRPVGKRLVGNEIRAKIDAYVQKKATNRAAQLVATARKILLEAQQAAPVDTGNLIASGYIVWTSGVKGTGGNRPKAPVFFPQNPDWPEIEDYESKMAENHQRAVSAAQAAVNARRGKTVLRVIIGFSAYHALWVHEGHTIFGKKNYAGIKYLERAVDANSGQL